MIYLIGLGLDWMDFSAKALEKLSRCNLIYLESYTSLSNYSVRKLSRFLGKEIISLGRREVEETKPFLKEAHLNDAALLVYGDPLTATTHIEILQECRKKKIKTEVIHSSSVLTAVAETGLQLYKFGKIASIPFWEKSHKPTSFVDVLKANKSINAHTLFLLDLRPGQNKFLSIKEAIDYLIKSEGISRKTLCVGCARLGMNHKIVAGTAERVAKASYGKPPYCLIVPAKLHFTEEEFLRRFR